MVGASGANDVLMLLELMVLELRWEPSIRGGLVVLLAEAPRTPQLLPEHFQTLSRYLGGFLSFPAHGRKLCRPDSICPPIISELWITRTRVDPA